MNADGSEQNRLTNNPGKPPSAVDEHPAWSPDGRKIAFVSYRDRNPEIYVMNADGSEQRNLTDNSAADRHPSWSPDGNKIAFYRRIRDLGIVGGSRRVANFEIHVMNADGSEQKNLTDNPALDIRPSWSPFLVSEEKE